MNGTFIKQNLTDEDNAVSIFIAPHRGVFEKKGQVLGKF